MSSQRLFVCCRAAGIALVLVFQTARVHADDEPRLHLSEDFFIDSAGQEHPFRLTYDRVFGDGRARPAYLRAVLEATVVLTIGTIWYWKAPSANTANYDFNSPLDKLKLSALRFDNNKLTTNMALHPVAGSAYYTFARFNRLSVPLSATFGIVYSTIWEYVLEWREKASINDLIVTPLAGVAMGEPFHRLIDYVGSAPPGGPWGRQVARYAIGWPRLVHEAFDGRQEDGLPPDSLGMSSAYYHVFHLSYWMGSASDDDDNDALVHGPSFESEIVALPGFLQRGRFHLFFKEGNFTEIRFRMGFEPHEGLEEIDGWFGASLYGYYAQDFTHPMHGEAHALSLVIAFTHHQSWLLGDKDEYAFVHFPGFGWDEWLAIGALLFHSQLQASLDFGAIRPVAYLEWRADNPDGVIKSVLSSYNYDFDWGTSGRLLLSLVYANFEAGLRFSYGHYWSIQGADRFQEKITLASSSHDELISYRVWVGSMPFPIPLELRAILETRIHQGWEENVRGNRYERRALLDLGLTF